jgi:signal transduction histidine kinase
MATKVPLRRHDGSEVVVRLSIAASQGRGRHMLLLTITQTLVGVPAAAIETQEHRMTAAAIGAMETLSHDIRTPLNGLIMSAELLENTSGLAPPARDLVGTIVACSQMLGSVVNDLLDFAKSECECWLRASGCNPFV